MNDRTLRDVAADADWNRRESVILLSDMKVVSTEDATPVLATW